MIQNEKFCQDKEKVDAEELKIEAFYSIEKKNIENQMTVEVDTLKK